MRKLRIGILAHEFLINIGANDFLKNIIRGLSLRRQNDIIFLHPTSNQRIEHITPSSLKGGLKKIPYIKPALRAIARDMMPVADKFLKKPAGEYTFYAEACPRMDLVACEINPQALVQIQQEIEIDVFLPSIHVLPKFLPYVTYWPDCQPKHFPEFFDDESQRVRDERITGLLNSGKPMIINSRAAKADMARFYGANLNRVFELPFAPIIEFDKLIPRPELLAPYGLARPYFMICNQFWVHKSIETVIEAAALVKKEGMEMDLVFTGRMEEPRKPGYINGLRQMVNDYDVGDTVKFFGYIPKDDQLELMKRAIAVIQPTLFEGGPGGGAVYDAVSLGIRSIVSDIRVNNELPIDSKQIVLFEPKNAWDLVRKITEFMSTPYENPAIEDLYQQSKRSAERLSYRLYEAIDQALSQQEERVQ